MKDNAVCEGLDSKSCNLVIYRLNPFLNQRKEFGMKLFLEAKDS